VQARNQTTNEKPPSDVRKLIPAIFLNQDPPVISRDPRPMSGVMSVLKKDMRGRAIWQERFFVLARGDLAWFPVDAELNGYDVSKPLGRIPVKYIVEATIKSDGALQHNELDLITDKSIYHFRSDMNKEVNRWQEAIMNTAPPGGEKWLQHKPRPPPARDTGPTKNAVDFFNDLDVVVNPDNSVKQGGIPFNRDPALITDEQENLLKSLFEVIAGQDVTEKDKQHIEDTDLASFVEKRMADDSIEVPDMSEISEAIAEAINMGHDEKNQCTYEAFKIAVCAKIEPGKTDGSTLAKILRVALAGKEDVSGDEALQGQMTIGQKLYEYHKFMQNVTQTCREGSSSDTVGGKISLNKTVAESYLDNVVHEVQALIKRHEAYKARMRQMEPSLRQRTQHEAVDDVFDAEMLPGERWS